jgi:anti-sigma B factor antagonist
MSRPLAFRTQVLGTCLIVRVEDDIDLKNGRRLSEALRELTDQGSTVIVVDLHGVKRAEGAGLRSLVGAHRRARSAGGGVWLARAKPAVRKIIEACRLHDVLTISEEIGDAVESAMTFVPDGELGA